MKIVFPLVELTDAIEDAAANLFEQKGGDLGEGALLLAGINEDTQDLMFELTDGIVNKVGVVVVDLSPVVTDERAGNDSKLDGVNPDD